MDKFSVTITGSGPRIIRVLREGKVRDAVVGMLYASQFPGLRGPIVDGVTLSGEPDLKLEVTRVEVDGAR